MPKQTTRATNLGTNLLTAFDSHGNGAAAKAFIDWMFKPENYAIYCQKSGNMPSVKDMSVDYGYRQEVFDQFQQEIAASDPISGFQITWQLETQYAGKAMTGDPLKDQTIKYLNGEQDVDTTIATINQLFDEQLGGV
jgi:alpha-1,4-digalacturonate transport system substrate-binding protein